MTRDPGRPGRLEPVDDAAIEQLVRDVASGWTMPAVRLDAPSWRDRIRGPRARRLDSARGWLARVGQAASAAVALTVVAALVAVVITRPPTTPGKSAEPTNRALDPRTDRRGVHATAADAGGWPGPDAVDRAHGDRGGRLRARRPRDRRARDRSITGAAYGSILRQRPDGTLICLCVKLASNMQHAPDRGRDHPGPVRRDRRLISTVSVASLKGEPDPRDGTLPERPPHLTFDLQFSQGGRYGVIGWSLRKHPVWQSGITIVDLADGHIVSKLDLPDDTSGEGDTRRVVTAPRLLDTGADGTVAIAREWYSWSPPESQGQNYRQETDVFRATWSGGVLADATPLDAAAGCGERVIRAGRTGAGGSWLVCTRVFTNQLVVRRLDADGALARRHERLARPPGSTVTRPRSAPMAATSSPGTRRPRSSRGSTSRPARRPSARPVGRRDRSRSARRPRVRGWLHRPRRRRSSTAGSSSRQMGPASMRSASTPARTRTGCRDPQGSSSSTRRR